MLFLNYATLSLEAAFIMLWSDPLNKDSKFGSFLLSPGFLTIWYELSSSGLKSLIPWLNSDKFSSLLSKRIKGTKLLLSGVLSTVSWSLSDSNDCCWARRAFFSGDPKKKSSGSFTYWLFPDGMLILPPLWLLPAVDLVYYTLLFSKPLIVVCIF